jgi:hypothetical protein
MEGLLILAPTMTEMVSFNSHRLRRFPRRHWSSRHPGHIGTFYSSLLRLEESRCGRLRVAYQAFQPSTPPMMPPSGNHDRSPYLDQSNPYTLPLLVS